MFQNGQTALCIAQKLGYISVVETLKVVTDQVRQNNTLVFQQLRKILFKVYGDQLRQDISVYQYQTVFADFLLIDCMNNLQVGYLHC